MKALLDHTPDELRASFLHDGVEPFRAGQVLRWVYGRRVHDFREMSDLSRGLRENLAGAWRIRCLEREALHDSLDGTRKLVLRTRDGGRIHAVLIPEQRRRTLCVSSQVGCALDCPFCATGRLGFLRNLRTEEIIDQVLHAAEILGPSRETVTHVVFMGMGEPLLNLPAVIQAIRILADPRAGMLSPRRITVSTAGVVPRIEELGRAVPVRLAISLHATTDAVRDVLVPLNRRFPIASLLEACRRYPLARRDRISFEYVLIRGMNDSLEDARRLARLLRGLHAKVNLIPLNEYPGSSFRRPDAETVKHFVDELGRLRLTATVRRSRGEDILAACGQLGPPAPTEVEQAQPASSDKRD